MTTTVTIEAHCSDEKAVLVEINDRDNGNNIETIVLQNGEKAVRYVFDDRELSVTEYVK